MQGDTLVVNSVLFEHRKSDNGQQAITRWIFALTKP
jgi:hypothetical protein